MSAFLHQKQRPSFEFDIGNSGSVTFIIATEHDYKTGVDLFGQDHILIPGHVVCVVLNSKIKYHMKTMMVMLSAKIVGRAYKILKNRQWKYRKTTMAEGCITSSLDEKSL